MKANEVKYNHTHKLWAGSGDGLSFVFQTGLSWLTFPPLKYSWFECLRWEKHNNFNALRTALSNWKTGEEPLHLRKAFAFRDCLSADSFLSMVSKGSQAPSCTLPVQGNALSFRVWTRRGKMSRWFLGMHSFLSHYKHCSMEAVYFYHFRCNSGESGQSLANKWGQEILALRRVPCSQQKILCNVSRVQSVF